MSTVAKILACLMLVGLILTAADAIYDKGYEQGASDESAALVAQINEANDNIKRITKERQDEIKQISKDYQERLNNIEESTQSTINRLNSDNKRLYVKLKNSNNTGAGASANSGGCLTDGKAELDPRTTESLIRVTTKGDLWIEALQETIRSLTDGRKEGK